MLYVNLVSIIILIVTLVEMVVICCVVNNALPLFTLSVGKLTNDIISQITYCLSSDPPLDPLHIPEGEWVCHSCRPSPAHMENHKNSLFGPLLIQAYSENPSVFTLPSDMMEMAVVKGIIL